MGLTISVALCTFNGERFLGAQLESIGAQDRLPDELIICDDGSSDSSIEIIGQFSQRAPFPVRLVINEKNLGTTKNFEKAISLCQSAIVALADQDDIWYRFKLAKIERAFLDSSAVGVFGDADVIDEDSKPLGVGLWDSFQFEVKERQRFSNSEAVRILTKHHIVTGATMAFRKNLFAVLAPFHDFQDRWLSFLLAAYGQFEAIAEPLMQYRRHRGQQFGPGSLSLREHIAQVRRTDANFYRSEINRFHKLYDRLETFQADFKYANLALREIERKIYHLERRIQLPENKVARIPEVMREMLNGDYWRYSAGWKSVAKDLVQAPQR